jgi:predicted GTPase
MSQTLKNALLLGQTGAGKSTVAQALAAHLGHVGIVFEASDKIEAHTQKPKSVTVGGIKVTDSPGLMDTEGRGKDIKNMELIVTTVRGGMSSLEQQCTRVRCIATAAPLTNSCNDVQAKSDTGLHAAILVLNEANDRFDSALQGT